MKLHLPPGLRRVLLSTFTISSALFASAAGASLGTSAGYGGDAGLLSHDGTPVASVDEEIAMNGASAYAGDIRIVTERPVFPDYSCTALSAPRMDEDLFLSGLPGLANITDGKGGDESFLSTEGHFMMGELELTADDPVFSGTNYFMDVLGAGSEIDFAADASKALPDTIAVKEVTLTLTDTVAGGSNSGSAHVKDADLTLEDTPEEEGLEENKQEKDASLSEGRTTTSYDSSDLITDESLFIFSEVPANTAGERIMSVYEYFMKEGAIQREGDDTIMIDTGNTMRLDSDLEGSADFHKTGDGTLIIDSPSSYKGTFHLSEGTLAVEASNAYGSESTLLIDGDGVTLRSGTLGGGAVHFDSGLFIEGDRQFTVETLSDTTWNGVLGGSQGTMTKTGEASLAIANIDSKDFAAVIRVNEGDLVLKGNIGSSIALAGRTMLSGSGSTTGHVAALGDDTVIEIGEAGGLCGVTTLTVGSLKLKYAENGRGGTKTIFDLDLVRNVSDKLIVIGKAELNYSVVEIRTDGDTAEQEKKLSGDERYALVEAGEIFGTFQSEVLHDFYFHNAHVEYTSTGVDLVLSLNHRGVSKNGNQTSIDNVLSWLDRDDSVAGELGEMIDALGSTRSADEARAAIGSAGGVGLTTTMSSLIAGNISHLRTLRASMGEGVCRTGLAGSDSALSDTNVWVSPVAGYNRASSDSNAPGFSRSSWGGLMGVERCLAQNSLAGLALGYDHARTSVTGDKYESDNCTVDLYGSFRSGPWQHRATAGIGFHDLSNDRFVIVGDRFGRRSRGKTDGLSLNLSYELSYEFALSETSSIAPLFTVESSVSRIDGYREGGDTGSAGLEVAKQDAWATVLGLGVRHTRSFHMLGGAPAATVKLSALVTADVGDQSASVDASFLGAPGRTFTLNPASMDRIGGLIEAGVTVPVTDRFSTFGGVSFEYRGDTRDLNANAGVRYAF